METTLESSSENISIENISIDIQKLVKLREDAGLSISEAARQLGLPSRQRLNAYEKEEDRIPPDILARMIILYSIKDIRDICKKI